jgi:putative membrane-bound dehydrogenase-like protein
MHCSARSFAVFLVLIFALTSSAAAADAPSVIKKPAAVKKLVIQKPPAVVALPRSGTVPTDAKGAPLNLDFESGTLANWKAEGDAFARQPVKGDTVHARRDDMRSDHAGQFWIGTYEIAGDKPRGKLSSVPFKVTQPFASFLVGGGSSRQTRVEVVLKDSDQVIYQVSGDDNENMKPVAVDLSQQMGKQIYIRLVDDASDGWGHINFDDFRFHAAKPNFPARPAPQALDVYAHAGLPPLEAAKDMTVPEGFSVTLYAGEPDVVQPIAQAIDDRGRLWIAEAYSYPRRVPDKMARDRILIFQDTDGDGHFDTRKVFADKLNLVSGLEVGFGGVWVGAAPNLLFIPDADGDDRPDGPPQVVLDGWGYQDTHETLNTFTWGPDGWLYGCHGVFTHSRVGKPGTPQEQRVPINAGLWRYHPTKKVFEVFAEGTSNPWGVDFNDQGQAMLTACVIPHLFHMIQGGRFDRQAGQPFNPYTYDDIKTIALHRHWVGATPHGGNNRSDSAGGGHAHAGAMIYLGDRWPEKYHNQIFMNNIHGARLNQDQLTPQGSGYVGNRAPDFLLANDSWSQIINLQLGPDGQMYMIDWYDKNQCHRTEVDAHDRTNGRIFRVSYGETKPVHVDLKKLSSQELVKLQLRKNDWYVRHARRILQERGPDPSVVPALTEMAFEHADETRRLRGLWALHAIRALGEEQVARGLANDSPLVRAWTIQFALEDKHPSDATLATLARLAKDDPSPVVRLYLASAAGRLPPEKRWDIVDGLLRHAEDAGDHNLPLMYWFAAEPLAEVDAGRALNLAMSARLAPVLAYMTRRIGALDSPDAIAILVDAIASADKPDVQRTLLAGINESLKGRRKVDMPLRWPPVYQRMAKAEDAEIRAQATALAITFGDPVAMKAMREVLSNHQADLGARQNALAALLKVKDPGLATTLQALVDEPALRSAALRALAAYDDAKTPEVLLAHYQKLAPAEKRDALGTLASRVSYAQALLSAVGDKRIASADLSADLIRQLRNLKSKELDQKIAKVWGAVRDTPQDKLLLIAHYKKLLTAAPQQPPDVVLGRAVFAKTCQKCHTLFGVGAKVGPELTGSNRADLNYVLSNVLDSSALVGKDYQTTVIQTTGGRVLTGLVRAEDKNSVTLVTADATEVIPKGEIDQRELSDKSMMPDDLWKPLSNHEIRSLVAYLASPAQTPILATTDNLATLFNGQDLTGWQGDSSLWSVENGEIVGRTAGLKRNEFLRSDMAVGDFRLEVKVKLVDNRGNSGIQFRSEALPDGEMKGYQADVGKGWWGKLYEENGRALLWNQSGEKYVKPGDWNTYEVVAVGAKIRTSINGHECVKLDDPSGAARGILAFQLHAGDPTEVRFKDIKLELNPRAEIAAGAGN